MCVCVSFVFFLCFLCVFCAFANSSCFLPVQVSPVYSSPLELTPTSQLKVAHLQAPSGDARLRFTLSSKPCSSSSSSSSSSNGNGNSNGNGSSSDQVLRGHQIHEVEGPFAYMVKGKECRVFEAGTGGKLMLVRLRGGGLGAGRIGLGRRAGEGDLGQRGGKEEEGGLKGSSCW